MFTAEGNRITSIKFRIHGLFVFLMLLTLTACSAPTPTGALAQPAVAVSEAPAPAATSQGDAIAATNSIPVRTKPAPPMSDPLPPELAPPASASAKQPPAIDQTCRTNADCAVKDVGSCCGAMPACVNRNSRTDPAAVRAECARKGMSSVCGFNEITACTCVNGQCISEQEPVGGWINGAAPPQADR